MVKNPKAIYTLCEDPESAERAVNRLRRAGVERREIAVVSSEPFEDHEFFRRDHKTLMPWLAALGGVVGGMSGYLLSALTQRSYPLPTGNMPIVALWPTGVIVYEAIMLGAIVFTLLTLLASARIPNLRRKLYDVEISDGKILVGALNPSDAQRAEIEKILREAGSGVVKEFGT